MRRSSRSSALRFLLYYPVEPDALGIVYAVLAYVGHFALLAALPVGLIVVPLACIVRRRAVVTAVAVLLAGASLALLVVDGNVFAEQRYHLTPLTVALFETPTWVFIALIGVFALTFEALLAGYVWRWVERQACAGRPRAGGRAGSLLARRAGHPHLGRCDRPHAGDPAHALSAGLLSDSRQAHAGSLGAGGPGRRRAPAQPAPGGRRRRRASCAIRYDRCSARRCSRP